MAGTRAVFMLLRRPATPPVQRHAELEPLTEEEEPPEVTVEPGETEGTGVLPPRLEEEEEEGSSNAAVINVDLTVSRQHADIPAPPPNYPSKTRIVGAKLRNSETQKVFGELGSLWALTCSDGLERGFPILWKERSDEIFASGDPVRTDLVEGLVEGPQAVPSDASLSRLPVSRG